MHRPSEEESAAPSRHSIIDQRDYCATFKLNFTDL